MTTITVVGAGFSGTLLALHLLRRCPPWTRICLIERNPQFGRGPAYATGNPNHLLNVPAGRMSAFHDRPDDFLAWLGGQPAEVAGQVHAGSFVSRGLFGAYVRHLLNAELKDAEHGHRLDLLRGEVTGLDASGPRIRLLCGNGRCAEADLVVLALGNFPPEAPPVADMAFYDSRFYRPDPWAADSFTELDREAPVLLIGTGLTTVDGVVSLLGQGHRGPIHALSRRGKLPLRHGTAAAQPALRPVSWPTRLTELTRMVRGEAAFAEANGSNWQRAVDELRPFTVDVWQSLSAEDRKRFLRHLRVWWDIHRHRLAPMVADQIDAARASGQLRIIAGRVRAYAKLADDLVEVTYRPRGRQDELRTLAAARVVNCAGPGADYARISHPLVRSLLQDGLVRPDRLQLGLDVTGAGALRGADGAVSGRLFAIGPVTKGMFWEMTAVPDIRRQCEVLATHLAMLARPPVAMPMPMVVPAPIGAIFPRVTTVP
jgi:uncharacterized NAD(P)/FAD-binding protein YdhS